MGSTRKRLHILDSLRGLAAIIVCFHHFFSINFSYFSKTFSSGTFNLLNKISNLNHLAVLFFFILSGFSIGLATKSRPLENKAAINDYLYRRFKRILPIYFISILLALIVGATMQKLDLSDYSLRNLIGNLLFLQTSKHATNYWFVPYGLNGPLWSLAYEMFFYILFPIVSVLNKKLLKASPTSIKLILLFIASLSAIFLNKLFFIPYLAYFSHFIIWIFGFLISLTYLYQKSQHGLFFTLPVLAMIYLNQDLIKSESLTSIFQASIIAFVFYFFVQFSSIISATILGSVEKILNLIFLYTGKGSFALYAFHIPVFLVLDFFEVPITFQLLLFLGLIAVSKNIEDFFIKKDLSIFRINFLGIIPKTTNR